MRESLEREWSDVERALAERIVQLVWDARPHSAGKMYIAVNIGILGNSATPTQKRIAREKIQDLMPLVVKIASKAHVGHSILTKPTGELLFTTNEYLVVKQELIRFHQMVTKLTRIDDSFGVLKEGTDPALRSFAYGLESFRTMLLAQDEKVKEVMRQLGILE